MPSVEGDEYERKENGSRAKKLFPSQKIMLKKLHDEIYWDEYGLGNRVGRKMIGRQTRHRNRVYFVAQLYVVLCRL